MRKLLFLIISVLFQSTVCAQTRVMTDEHGVTVTEVNYQNEKILRYKGSVFFKDSVELGTFSVSGGQTFQKPVLFDIMHQNFLAAFDTRIVAMRNTNLQLGDRHFKNINNAYYETFYDGKIKILIKYSCALKDFPKGYKDGIPVQVSNDYAGEVVRKKDYFLLFPNNKLRSINLSKYSVNLAIIREYEGLLYHLQQWKKDVENEEDLIELLDYLNDEGFL